MKFSRADADVFSPDAVLAETALARTTHLCVAAHQDDIEIMAHSGITTCYEQPRRHFTGVVVTDGAGSPRSGPYASLNDAEMRDLRRNEQRRAAVLGKYNLQLQLAHPSSAIKTADPDARADLCAIFSACAPEIVYLHSPADKHDTHVALLLRCLEVLRMLPIGNRPRRVVGCEVWRDLDWLVDRDKIALDASARPDLAAALLRLFDSQISGGKRYDAATLGRRAANATFHTAHATDEMTAVTWAMDLTPLIVDERLNVRDYTLAHVERLRADIAQRLEKFGA
ncbi:MAG: PIG-L family deacetylase [Opitutaceae bacterium]